MDTAPVPPASTSPPPLRKNYEYLILQAGRVVSSLGSGMSNLAMPLLVLLLTGSPAQTALVTAVEGIPLLVLSLPAGALVDRWPRKRVMVICDTGRMLTVGSVPLTAATGHLTIAQLYVVALVEGTLALFFGLAAIAAIPRVVPKSQLPAATAQGQALGRTAALVSPSIGGLLFQTLGPTAPYLADAISYAGSVLSILFLKTELQGSARPQGGALSREVVEGVRWLWAQPLLRLLAFLTAGFMFIASGTPLIIIVLARHDHASSAVIGTLFSIEAIGGITGAVLAQRVSKKLTFVQAIVGMEWVMVILTPLFAIVPNVFLLGVVAAVLAMTSPIYNVIAFGYRIALVPDHLQGRINSVYRLIALGFAPIGTALTGVLLQVFGPRVTVLLDTGAFLVLAILVSLSKTIRTAPDYLGA